MNNVSEIVEVAEDVVNEIGYDLGNKTAYWKFNSSDIGPKIAILVGIGAVGYFSSVIVSRIQESKDKKVEAEREIRNRELDLENRKLDLEENKGDKQC